MYADDLGTRKGLKKCLVTKIGIKQSYRSHSVLTLVASALSSFPSNFNLLTLNIEPKPEPKQQDFLLVPAPLLLPADEIPKRVSISARLFSEAVVLGLRLARGFSRKAGGSLREGSA